MDLVTIYLSLAFFAILAHAKEDKIKPYEKKHNVAKEEISGNYEITTQDFCSSEVFDVKCARDEVLVMHKALYGRMRPGRCVTQDYPEHIGCSKDVLPYMDSQCSGKVACNVPVGILEREAQPCNKDFKSYLQATYSCLKVASSTGGSCKANDVISLAPPNGFITRSLLTERGADLGNCAWSLVVPPGQMIVLHLLTFTTQAKPVATGDYAGCGWYAVLREGTTSVREISLCRTEERKMQVYRSASNNVHLTFYSTSGLDTLPFFVLEYSAHGCADVAPPNRAFLKRENDNLMIRCNETGETWYLTCRDNEWIGEFGNCTAHLSPIAEPEKSKETSGFFQEGIIFAVFIGLVLGLVMGTAMLAAVFVWRKRSRQRAARNRHNGSSDQLSVSNRNSFPGLLRQEKPVGGNVCEYTHVWEVKPQPLMTQSTTLPRGKDDMDLFKDMVKSNRIYETHAALSGATALTEAGRHTCPKEHHSLYYELDPTAQFFIGKGLY